LSEVLEARTRVKILTEDFVGVFVQAPLPGVMRCSEVERDACGVFSLPELMELGAVVSGDGAYWTGLLPNRLGRDLGTQYGFDRAPFCPWIGRRCGTAKAVKLRP
jgi:hypothetical protein